MKRSEMLHKLSEWRKKKMKRSEMVHKLSDVLAQFLPNTELKQRNLIADVLLYEAEQEAGILIPKDDFCWGGWYVCKWEQEDEAK